jgi:hypothetical protein
MTPNSLETHLPAERTQVCNGRELFDGVAGHTIVRACVLRHDKVIKQRT